MTTAKVYFSDLRTSFKESLPSKIVRLAERAGIDKVVSRRNLVAVKLHFGEKGNTAFIRPILVKPILQKVKELKGSPFLTDSNTLYAGTRGDSVSHLLTAAQNGFTYPVIDAPVIIADGLRGASFSKVKINQEIIETAYIGKDIVESDALISLAHFKGHELSGFGGAIKNLGMGCASRKGKMDQHSGLSPKIKSKKCVGCGDCVGHCSQKALSIREEKASIDETKCIGCGECILVCPNGAIDVQWNADIPLFQKKMVEYTVAVLKGKKEKSLFFNYLIDISPACDCYGNSDAPIVNDIGIVASTDPVAIDQASVDLVNQQQAAAGSCLKNCTSRGEDKFRGVYPKIDWNIQLEHGENIGLGCRKYELIPI